MGAVKWIAILLVVIAIGGGLFYVSKLQADLAVSQQNEEKLKDSVGAQQRLIEGMQQDIKDIQASNEALAAQAEQAREEVKNLADKFDKRDFGLLASQKPALIERLINRGTKNAIRCLELASGAPHTEQELAAKSSSEINRECPAIANPNYISTTP